MAHDVCHTCCLCPFSSVNCISVHFVSFLLSLVDIKYMHITTITNQWKETTIQLGLQQVWKKHYLVACIYLCSKGKWEVLPKVVACTSLQCPLITHHSLYGVGPWSTSKRFHFRFSTSNNGYCSMLISKLCVNINHLHCLHSSITKTSNETSTNCDNRNGQGASEPQTSFSASSGVAWAVWPSCHRNSRVLTNGFVRISHRVTFAHWTKLYGEKNAVRYYHE